jgi:hypothetical protein
MLAPRGPGLASAVRAFCRLTVFSDDSDFNASRRLRYGRRWAPVTKPSSTGRRPMRQAASFGRFDNVWYGRGVGLIGNVRPQRLANRY